MSINKNNFDLLCSSCKEKIQKIQKIEKNNYNKYQNYSSRCKNNIIINNNISCLSTYDNMMNDINELTMKEWLDNWWTCIH